MQRFSGSFIHNLNRTIIRKISLRRIQLYSTPVSSSTTEDSFANDLVNSLSFSNQKAQSASNKVSRYRPVNDFNFDSNDVTVVGFFKTYGFNDTHLRSIVSFYPQVLCSNVDNILRPKLQLLRDQGFLESDIIQVVYRNPRLLMSGAESSILPAFEVLRNVMGSEAHVIALLKRSKVFYFSTTKYLIPNVALLTSYGIPIEVIRKHILMGPAAFMRKHEIFSDMVTNVKNEWGICPNSSVFLYGIELAGKLTGENIESKCQMFKSFGWTKADIQTLIVKRPSCFTFSEATIKKKLNFLMNELRLEPGYLTSHSVLLTLSLEKRFLPRHNFLLFLEEKGLLEYNPSLGRAMCISESRFLNMFVLPFKEVHQVYAELTGCSMEMLIQESSQARS